MFKNNAGKKVMSWRIKTLLNKKKTNKISSNNIKETIQIGKLTFLLYGF